ncbi:MAG: ImmA/IrrE family metallo-endopeptidase [Gemmatimonadota bacterium]|nr:ImmA/IrrE family metallo-endopeptidase [Gemmatimonadota bacterium]
MTQSLEAAPSSAQVNKVRAAVRSFRQRHPELRDSPTVAAIRRAMRREGIGFMWVPWPPNYRGMAAELLKKKWLSLNRDMTHPLEKRYVMLHELGHFMLGHTVRSGPYAEARRAEFGAPQRPLHDAAELEAELFAELLGAPPCDSSGVSVNAVGLGNPKDVKR